MYGNNTHALWEIVGSIENQESARFKILNYLALKAIWLTSGGKYCKHVTL